MGRGRGRGRVGGAEQSSMAIRNIVSSRGLKGHNLASDDGEPDPDGPPSLAE